MQPDELARVRAFIAEHQWHFAKTMPMIPHRYSVNLVNNRELFLPLHQDSSKGNSFEGMTTLPIIIGPSLILKPLPDGFCFWIIDYGYE